MNNLRNDIVFTLAQAFKSLDTDVSSYSILQLLQQDPTIAREVADRHGLDPHHVYRMLRGMNHTRLAVDVMAAVDG